MSINIQEITICLHCGSDKSIVFKQMDLLSPLEKKYKIYWNNRIDRYPFAYPSYSKLINDSIQSSPTEFMLLINDRTTPLLEHAEKIIYHLENGFACSLMYNVGFMGFSKELVREIGWWDERYLNGGWEDRDWVFRIKMADLALYESQEGIYDYSWKSPLQINDRCAKSLPHFEKKWEFFNDKIVRKINEENYPDLNKAINIENRNLIIKNSWKTWQDSILGIGFDKLNSGPPSSSWIKNKKVISGEQI
jgi:hypothetical protein